MCAKLAVWTCGAAMRAHASLVSSLISTYFYVAVAADDGVWCGWHSNASVPMGLMNFSDWQAAQAAPDLSSSARRAARRLLQDSAATQRIKVDLWTQVAPHSAPCFSVPRNDDALCKKHVMRSDEVPYHC